MDPDTEQVRRREATSLAHLLTHSPKNPFCSICARTHVRPIYHRKGAFMRKVEQWGDIVTADHVDCRQTQMIGLDDQRGALIVRDLYSGLIQTYPVSSRTAEETATSIQHFRGTFRIKVFYTEGAPEFERACADLQICHETSRPGDSKNNGIIERLSLIHI